MPIDYAVDGDAVVVTIALPDSRNGLDEEIVATLRHAIQRASTEADARFLILQGMKGWFCIGGSGPFMERLLAYDVPRRAAASRAVQGIIEDLIHCPLLTVAILDGLAAGAGADMVLASDLVLAGDETRFALLYAKLGLIPDTGFSLLDWRLGARALLTFAESKVLDAAELVATRLAEPMPDADLPSVLRFLRRRFRFVPQAFAAAKCIRNAEVFADLAERLDAVAMQQALQFEEIETRNRLLHSAASQRRAAE